MADEDLSKPFKKVLKCPFTKQITKFSTPWHKLPTNAKIYDGTSNPEDHITQFTCMGNQGEWPMPVWCWMFQQTLDGKARAWFDILHADSIDNWGDLQEKFLNRFGMLKACSKDPMEISKKIWRANETLLNFKEMWASESNAILIFPELMQISSFMSSHKCSKLSKRFLDIIPKTVDEMFKRVDNYVRSKEAFCNTKLPRSEFQRKEGANQWVQKNDRLQKNSYRNIRLRPDHRPNFRPKEHHAPYVTPHRPQQNFLRPREYHKDNKKSWKEAGDRAIRKSKIAGKHMPNRGGIGQPDLSGSASHNKQKLISGRLHPTKESPQRQLRCFHMGTFRYDRGTKEDHQEHPQRQPIDYSSQLKKRVFSAKRSQVVTQELAEWLKAGIVRTVQMTEEDEEKTAFYTDQGTFCYTKMPFGLKMQGQHTKDVAETFNNLRRINVKLNPKKCSFGWKKENSWDTCAIKGQILTNFINEAPVGSDDMVPRTTPYTIDYQKDCKE
uniref:Reverse transcriptase domain-containing protein n=1 Tax=Tanacetum cinerariifolium TaxID=118510 RepID=A0A6L2L9F7_TANCI|nr:reverse transcriptase domain-containing protein [Tanacetum cinerariifolium]